jgi:hypothetical protein
MSDPWTFPDEKDVEIKTEGKSVEAEVNQDAILAWEMTPGTTDAISVESAEGPGFLFYVGLLFLALLACVAVYYLLRNNPEVAANIIEAMNEQTNSKIAFTDNNDATGPPAVPTGPVIL